MLYSTFVERYYDSFKYNQIIVVFKEIALSY